MILKYQIEILKTKLTDATSRKEFILPWKVIALVAMLYIRLLMKKLEDKNNEKWYIGTTEMSWKKSWCNHKFSFNNRKWQFYNIVKICISKKKWSLQLSLNKMEYR